MSLDEKGQGSVHFFQGSPSRCASFKFFSNSDIANLGGLNAAEVGFLVVKPFKKHTFLASDTNREQTGNAPVLPNSFVLVQAVVPVDNINNWFWNPENDDFQAPVLISHLP